MPYFLNSFLPNVPLKTSENLGGGMKSEQWEEMGQFITQAGKHIEACLERCHTSMTIFFSKKMLITIFAKMLRNRCLTVF